MLKTLVSKEGNICIVKLIGDLDIATEDSFKDTMEKEIKDTKEVTIDFSKLEFLDSTGVMALMQVIRNKGQESSFKIINIRNEIYEVLDILGIPELFGEEIFNRT